MLETGVINIQTGSSLHIHCMHFLKHVLNESMGFPEG